MARRGLYSPQPPRNFDDLIHYSPYEYRRRFGKSVSKTAGQLPWATQSRVGWGALREDGAVVLVDVWSELQAPVGIDPDREVDEVHGDLAREFDVPFAA
jgi:hypothetical protein